MKHLIIHTHHQKNSFTTAITKTLQLNSRKNGELVQVIDLYAEGFNPVLSSNITKTFQILKYQDLIYWSTHLSFVFPLWWAHMPAMLKGFFDRVFTEGFAFSEDENGFKGLLGNKTAHLYILSRTSNIKYNQSKMHDAISKLIIDGIMNVSGIDTKISFFGSIIESSFEQREEYLKEIQEINSQRFSTLT